MAQMPPPNVLTSRWVARSAVAMVVLGLLAAVSGHIWNAQPLPPEDGANIGAGGLELLGIVVFVAGLVMCCVVALRSRFRS
jgi:hypothetical protein